MNTIATTSRSQGKQVRVRRKGMESMPQTLANAMNAAAALSRRPEQIARTWHEVMQGLDGALGERDGRRMRDTPPTGSQTRLPPFAVIRRGVTIAVKIALAGPPSTTSRVPYTVCECQPDGAIAAPFVLSAADWDGPAPTLAGAETPASTGLSAFDASFSAFADDDTGLRERCSRVPELASARVRFVLAAPNELSLWIPDMVRDVARLERAIDGDRAPGHARQRLGLSVARRGFTPLRRGRCAQSRLPEGRSVGPMAAVCVRRETSAGPKSDGRAGPARAACGGQRSECR